MWSTSETAVDASVEEGTAAGLAFLVPGLAMAANAKVGAGVTAPAGGNGACGAPSALAAAVLSRAINDVGSAPLLFERPAATAGMGGIGMATPASAMPIGVVASVVSLPGESVFLVCRVVGWSIFSFSVAAKVVVAAAGSAFAAAALRVSPASFGAAGASRAVCGEEGSIGVSKMVSAMVGKRRCRVTNAPKAAKRMPATPRSGISDRFRLRADGRRIHR
jgi:hypothetical protein